MTLAEQNAALIEKSMGMLSDEVKAVYGENQKHVEAQEHLKNAFGVGDTAPMFELPDADGNTVSLAEVLKNGPTVVSFYRGAWCPFCNLELRAMQQELANAEAANVTLVAISPNTPDISSDFAKEIEVTFPVLSDVDNVVAKQFNDILFSGKNVMMEFYAPWCGHCKKLAPVWDELGTAFADSDKIVVAKMDATANDVPDSRFDVKGFPTLVFITAEGEIVKYDGGRTIEDLKKFVQEKTGVEPAAAPAADADAKDEL